MKPQSGAQELGSIDAVIIQEGEEAVIWILCRASGINMVTIAYPDLPIHGTTAKQTTIYPLLPSHILKAIYLI